MSDTNLSQNIKKYRKLKHLSQTALGRAIGEGNPAKSKSLSTIQKYESGDITPPLDVIEQIANVLEVDVSDLLGIKEPSKDEILEDVKNIINDSNTRGYNNLAPLDKEKILNYFRNVLYNIDVIGPNPYDPKDEDLQRVLDSKEFKGYTEYLINQESNSEEE